MKLSAISKNVANFVAENAPHEKNTIATSGRPAYGQTQIVVTNEEELASLKIGSIYLVTLQEEEAEVEEEDDEEEEEEA
jgi:hypothetical protein